MSRSGHAGDSDAALAARAAQGDRRALETLLERHADRIHAICRRVLVDREDARDATQEALIAIARRIGSFDGRSQFTTWMYRVAVNAALDEARRRNRRPRPVDTDAHRERESSSSPAVDALVTDRLDVTAALASLPPEFRAAVALRDLADLDYATIAHVLDVPPGTVRSRIARGRALLAERLGNSEVPPRRLTERSP